MLRGPAHNGTRPYRLGLIHRREIPARISPQSPPASSGGWLLAARVVSDLRMPPIQMLASYDTSELTEMPQVFSRSPASARSSSTATVAAIGNGSAFRRGRDFAAWVGVVPRQYSTGGKQKLYGISKRGNVYLRRMLIHGARAVLFRVKYDTGGFGQWVHRLAQRAPSNKVVVAIANKLARIAWAVLSSGQDYRHQPLQQLTAA